MGELTTLFGHPLWRGCKSKGARHDPGPVLFKDHHYWINLLLAYTGARRSEIAGLRVSEVQEDDGILHVCIYPNHLRGLKNKFSRRRVPLHPHVIEMGFFDFVAQRRRRGHVALFPEAVPAKFRHLAHDANAPKQPYDKKFGDVLDHMLRASLARSLDGNPRGLSAHGMRHFVNDHLCNLRAEDKITLLVPDLDRLDILGRMPVGVNTASCRRSERPFGPVYEAIKLLPRVF